MREQAELVEYGFEDDPRYRNEKLPPWVRKARRRNVNIYRNGQLLRYLTDDPEDVVEN